MKSSLFASVLFLKLSSLHRFHHLTDFISMTLCNKPPSAVQNGNFFQSRQLKFIHITLNQHAGDIPGICLYPISEAFPSPSVRWSSHPWTRRATPTCRGLWSRVRRPREESTPSTRPLFSNIDPPCPLLCVCAFQRLPFTGAPPRSWAQATHAAASPHRLKKTKHPAPPPLVEPDHCMMTFGAALSQLSFLLPSRAPLPSRPSCLQGWRMSFEPEATVHFCLHL